VARQRVEANEGEYGFDFIFYLKDANADTITDLVGDETVTLWLKEPGETAFSTGSGSVNNIVTGEIYVGIRTADTTALIAGVYSGQLEVLGSARLLITMEVEVCITRRLGS